jgi:hypothetical protein
MRHENTMSKNSSQNCSCTFHELCIFLIAEKEFPEIKHSFDVWHGANNFGKMMI